MKNEHGEPALDAHGRKQYRLRSKYWWIRYYDASHRVIDESCASTKKGAAERLLRLREGAKERGEPVGPTVGRITFDEAVKAVEDDYRMNGRDTFADVRRRTTLHLQPYFTGRRMTAITTAEITAYVVARQQAGAAAATINREPAILKRAFRLAHRAGKLIGVPHVPMLHENNTRRGFFERDQFEAIRSHLPAEIQPLVTFAYYTGWRVSSEILTLRASQVNLQAGIVRLEPGTTKNDQGRQFDFGPLDELRQTIADQLTFAERISRDRGRIVSAVFHRADGEPIRDFRKAWRTACAAAGYPGKLPHDFRRTAVRNLERAGVSRSAAMAMVGHKTESIYRRYAIVDEAMQHEAAHKLNTFTTEQTQPPASARVRKFQRRG